MGNIESIPPELKKLENTLLVDPPVEFEYGNERLKINSRVLIEDVWGRVIRHFVSDLQRTCGITKLVQQLSAFGLVSKNLQKMCILEAYVAGVFNCKGCGLFAKTPHIHNHCDQLFCQACINHRTKPKCSYCTKPLLEEGFFMNTQLYQPAPQSIINSLNYINIRCLTCSKSMARKEFVNHYYFECEVDCPFGCEIRLTREEVPRHHKVCPQVEIPCQALELGCPYRCKRKEICSHENECVYVRMLPVFNSLIERIEKLEKSHNDENIYLKQKISALESKISSLSSKY